ncbi:hypothetical protein LMG31506_01124 [Cupriavidus yeoncheonensis]|uniref:Uncharacterized protein n=1 Tax=Cupriavidus yeoncheonensis TaxID=1462994 RepID=A0A916IR32_9BURK|nr:hypothetical protein [Cupriavidus yeoncheonensis]CAG2132949.1 hypothetical protein LMG31506_01124 [Cupriavidus yeoncheonensis]
MRTIRLFLLVLMLAFLPFQAWAGAVAYVPDAAANLAQHANSHPAGLCKAAEGTAPCSTSPTDLAEAPETSPAGIDLAEQLLPAPEFRVAAGPAQSGPPRYAGTALPDPDLPLLPRPPRG